MAKIPDGTFKNWQETNVVHAADYVQEREMLRAAANDNADRLSSLETVTNGLQLNTVQLQKITNDEGGVKITTTSTFDDILAKILVAGQGMHTFYAVTGSKNLPPTNLSIRGIAHFTSDTIGWVYATDYQNNIFTNYYDTNKWGGWRHLVSNEDRQETLWTGAAYMHGAAVVTPTRKLSDCRNGWVLEWSDFNPPSTSNEFDYHYSYVIKDVVKDKWVLHAIPNFVGTDGSITSVGKALKYTDTTITGSDSNSGDLSKDVVLRRVLEW